MKNEEMDLGTTFLQSALTRFREYKSLGDKTFAQLSESQLHFQPAETSNSIAIIIQHIHGNMLSRWTAFLTEDGEKPWRARDAEFETQPLSKEALLQRWHKGWTLVFDTLQALTPHDLLKKVTIRNQPLTVIDAINRQLAHYSSHVGQIIFLGKWQQGKNWQTLSIPKGSSQQYNEVVSGEGQNVNPKAGMGF